MAGMRIDRWRRRVSVWLPGWLYGRLEDRMFQRAESAGDVLHKAVDWFLEGEDDLPDPSPGGPSGSEGRQVSVGLTFETAHTLESRSRARGEKLCQTLRRVLEGYLEAASSAPPTLEELEERLQTLERTRNEEAKSLEELRDELQDSRRQLRAMAARVEELEERFAGAEQVTVMYLPRRPLGRG